MTKFVKRYRSQLLLLSIVVCVSCDPAKRAEKPPPNVSPERLLWAEVEVPSLQGSADLQGEGERIYRERCITCHGARGLGDGFAAAYMTTRPRDFSTGEYRLHSTTDFPSDEDLYRSITVGVPAFGMPSFEYLSANDRWALVEYIKALGQAAYAARLESEAVKDELGFESDEPNADLMAQHRDRLNEIHAASIQYAAAQLSEGDALPIPAAPYRAKVSLTRGEALYGELGCASCHGVNGDGEGNSIEAMTDNQGRVVRPRNFREGAWYFKAGNRRDDIVRVIIGGMPGTPMPSLDLGEKENRKLWDVAVYVQHLATTTDGALN